MASRKGDEKETSPIDPPAMTQPIKMAEAICDLKLLTITTTKKRPASNSRRSKPLATATSTKEGSAVLRYRLSLSEFHRVAGAEATTRQSMVSSSAEQTKPRDCSSCPSPHCRCKAEKGQQMRPPLHIEGTCSTSASESARRPRQDATPCWLQYRQRAKGAIPTDAEDGGTSKLKSHRDNPAQSAADAAGLQERAVDEDEFAVDELTDYFHHFVRLRAPIMSSQAESMYA